MRDRVPTQVLQNGAIRYEMFNSSGVSQGYTYLKLADEPTEEGTALNAQFGNQSFFVTYVHTRTGKNNALVNADGGDNIKFVATADFVDGDTFSVNGITCTAQTPDGEALTDGAFKSGTVVTCYKSGTVLNFKMGGGVALNFKFKKYTTTPSDSLMENTIGIVTTDNLKTWQFAVTAPTTNAKGGSLVLGDIWVAVDTSATISANLLRRGGITHHISAVYQYSGSAWVEKTSYIYQNSTWSLI